MGITLTLFMSNPFDHIMSEQHDEKIIPKPSKKEELHISFSLNRQTLERGIFVIVIIILGFMVFFNPFNDGEIDTGIGRVTGNVIVESEPVLKKVAKEPEITVTTEVDDEETTSDDTEEIDVPFTGNFAFDITKVDYTEDAGRPIKMESITFIMYNKWKNFKPKVVAYWYDGESSEAIRIKKRATLNMKEMLKGKKLTIKMDEFDSKYFDPQENEETIILELYMDDELLDSAKYEI